KKYGLDDYLIFVSTIQPRKNLPRLIEAYSEIVKEFPRLKLAVIGKLGWDYDESLAAPLKHDVEKSVLFLGRVPDRDLPALLSGAKLYINPSLTEGFGLSLLEAMACETPVAVSNIKPFNDLAENSALYFDPTKAQDIENVVLMALKEDGTREKRILLAKEIAKNHSWEETAKKTLRVFEDVVKNRQSNSRVFTPIIFL
ncbi:glycosyltransferase family 4 protein, partial [candidate division WWE3 bacterium]|nr:glycosyltransferase family 4 protein [candidate division WWE3 bacterium]